MSFLKDQLPKALLDAVHAVNLGDTGVSESGNNGTKAIEDRDYLFNKAIWETVSSQYPLTGLWPLAILLTFAALAILSILLKLAWSISRAKLSFFRIYKIHYDIKTSPFSSSSTYTWEESINQHGKSRTLILPAEGSVLLCALVSCIGTIARALSIETSGRVAWLSDFNLVARVVEFTGLWLAIIFIVIGSISHIPLFTSNTSPVRYLALSEQIVPLLPKSLAKPILHPLLASTLLFLVPFILCIIPNSLAFSKSYRSISVFQNALPIMPSSFGRLEETTGSISSAQDGVSLRSQEGNVGTVSTEINVILQDWRFEGYIRACSGICLLMILIWVEYRIQKRLSKTASYLSEVEEAALSESPAANTGIIIEKDPSIFRLSSDDAINQEDTYTRSPQSCVTRSRSILSSSSRGARTLSLYPNESPRRPQSVLSRSCIGNTRPPSSRASSSYRSFSAISEVPSRLYVPDMPAFDITLPSPSLIRDNLGASIRGVGGDGPSPYSPALALFGDRLDRSFSGPVGGFGTEGDYLHPVRSRTPSLIRGTSLSSNTSSLNCSEKRFDPSRQRERIFSLEHHNRLRECRNEESYFGEDVKLPYDLEDGYDAQLRDMEDSTAIVAHMLGPYDGIDEQEAPSTPSYMKRDNTQRSHLSRSYTPGLRNEYRPNLTSGGLSGGAPSLRSERGQYHIRPQSRASSYSYRTDSSSSSSAFSYASSRTAASWRSRLSRQEIYQGPSASHLFALKKSRAIEATLMASFILFQSLLDLACGFAGGSILESKAAHATSAFASMSLKVLPILGGVILSSLGSSAPAYGWQSRHIIVRSPDEQEMKYEDGGSFRSSLRYEKGVC